MFVPLPSLTDKKGERMNGVMNHRSGGGFQRIIREHRGQVSVSLKGIVYYFNRFLPLFPSNTCICWIAIWLSFIRRSP